GSTVVMLFPKNTVTFNRAWAPERLVCMGEMMGMMPAPVVAGSTTQAS
ncbi:MAG: hypothetical protein JWR25_1890, partial [Noviherbaspirillum sp.]|nr:hypothetical protein [Noviherbaspirillum sp.]